MLKAIAILLLISIQLSAADWTKLRRVAQAAACAATIADGYTTVRGLERGAVEVNPIYGHHPSAGLLIGSKVGLCAAQVVFAEWRHARHPGARDRIDTFAAVGQSAVFTGLAIHNTGVR